MIEDVIKIDKETIKDISKNLFDNIHTKEEYISFMLNYLQNKYPYTNVYSDNVNYKLSSQSRRYLELATSITYNGDSFKIYPYNANEKQASNYYVNILKEIINYHINYKVSYEEAFNIYINEYNNANQNIIEDLKTKKMMPYYGMPSFMYEKACYLICCAVAIDTNIPFDAYEQMKAFMEKYPEENNNFMRICSYYSDEFKRDYDSFEKNYLRMLEYEKSLVPKAKEVWSNFLTDVNSHDNSKFAYLAHTFTSGEAPPDKMEKVCTSLLTESIQTIGDFGLLYNANNIVDEICSDDAGSWEVTKDEFIERDMPKSWQFPSDENKTIFYEYPKISKILLPQTLINEFEYSKNNLYSEIVLTNYPKPIGVFYTDKCKDINKVTSYASKYNLPLIHITKEKIRFF